VTELINTKKTNMATWYPGALTYWQWCQANSFLNDFKSQSGQINMSIHEQTRLISDQTKGIVATNEQLTYALENGFKRLSEINERGFNKVTSAIEEMQSDLDYNFGILIQKVEYQNKLLNSILNTLQTPFETQIIELYNNGCKFIRQENLSAAVDCFKESISQKMGKYFFPSYYQLGRLYISGKVESLNIIDPKIAMGYLIEANELGNGIIKDDISFKPILSDCKFFLSQSYYFQMTRKDDPSEIDLLNNAIKYCKEAVSINPHLSQAYYHLAKYYSCKSDVENLLHNLEIAIKIDRDYSWKYEEDGVFNKYKTHILELLAQLKVAKKIMVLPSLQKARNYITQLEQKNISRSTALFSEFKNLKEIAQRAEEDFQTQTYFGFCDCESKLNNL
jgi:tetratricopeptide (TPR) repeat protein